MNEEANVAHRDARRIALKLLREHGRVPALNLTKELAEIDREAGAADPEFWDTVYALIELTTFELVSTGANTFKIRWFVPPEEAALQRIQ